MPDTSPLLSEADMDMVLRDGLRRLPTPPISADFDARVLAALARPPSPAESLRIACVSALRPLLCSAACSLALTLLALFWTLHTPLASPTSVRAPNLIRPLDTAAVDDLLSHPNLGAASLSTWARQSALPIPTQTLPSAHSDGERRPPTERRHASRPYQTWLMA